MKNVIPLLKLGLNNVQLKEHCEHIISHAERYEKERVFEAKEVLNNITTKHMNVPEFKYPYCWTSR